MPDTTSELEAQVLHELTLASERGIYKTADEIGCNPQALAQLVKNGLAKESEEHPGMYRVSLKGLGQAFNVMKQRGLHRPTPRE